MSVFDYAERLSLQFERKMKSLFSSCFTGFSPSMPVPLGQLSSADSVCCYDFHLVGCCVCHDRDVSCGWSCCHRCVCYVDAWTSDSRTSSEEVSSYGSEGAGADVGKTSRTGGLPVGLHLGRVRLLHCSCLLSLL